MNLTDLVNHVLVVKSNKAKASVSVRDFVISEHRLFNLGITTGLDLGSGRNISISHLGKLFKVSLDILKAGCGGKSTNEDLLCSHHQFGIRLPRYSNLTANH